MAGLFRDERVACARLIPGVKETLGFLKARDVRLALLTSGDAIAQRSKVVDHGLEPYFDTILIEGELGYGKPDRRIYDDALSALGVDIAETWAVGDSPEWDLETPQKLGAFGVWVVWPAPKYILMDLPPEAWPENSHVKPDLIIRRMSDLLDLDLQF